jgi:D-serine deaminase-like pyridoxal phosphate-dependent protein
MAGLNRRGFLTGTAGSAATVPLAGCAVAATPLEERSPKLEEAPDLGPDPWIELDQDALRANLKAIEKRVNRRPIMPVIKANGYGHGLAQIGRALERAGIEQLAVAKVSEAMALRREGVATTILSLGPFGKRDIPDIVAGRISQTVFTNEVEDLATDARRRGKVTPVQVNVDTGLGRVGVPHGQAIGFIERVASLSGIRLEGVFTGLTEDPEFDKEQLSRLKAVTDGAAAKGITAMRAQRHDRSTCGRSSLSRRAWFRSRHSRWVIHSPTIELSWPPGRHESPHFRLDTRTAIRPRPRGRRKFSSVASAIPRSAS